MLLVHPLLRAWPATQACALTGNGTGDPLGRRPALDPLSHASQGNVFSRFWRPGVQDQGVGRFGFIVRPLLGLLMAAFSLPSRACSCLLVNPKFPSFYFIFIFQILYISFIDFYFLNLNFIVFFSITEQNKFSFKKRGRVVIISGFS